MEIMDQSYWNSYSWLARAGARLSSRLPACLPGGLLWKSDNSAAPSASGRIKERA